MALPNSKSTFNDVTDNVDSVMASDKNELNTAVTAIENIIGEETSYAGVLLGASGVLKTHNHDGTGNNGAKVSFEDLTEGFALSGNGSKVVKVNSGATALEAVTLSSIPEHYIKGCRLIYSSGANFIVDAGTVEINGAEYRNTTQTTITGITTPANYFEGSVVSISDYVYVYVTPNSTNFAVKLSLSSPQYSDTDSETTGILRYRKIDTTWYRCIGALRTSTTTILEFVQNDTMFITQIYINNNTTTGVTISEVVPECAQAGLFFCSGTGGGTYYFYTTGMSNLRVTRATSGTSEFTCIHPVSSGEQVYFYTDVSSNYLKVYGWVLNIL